MKVAAYTRVSTDAQCKEDRYGLEAQREAITEYCANHDMEIVRWFTDEGESGAKYRPGFDNIVYGEVANPPYEAVVVAKSDRVARDINIYFYYKACLLRKDIQLISVAEDFGSFGVFAPMLESFVLCMAQMERENITKRTAGGRRVKASRGGYSGGRAPMGYRIKDGNLTINPDEVPVVLAVFDARKRGLSIAKIAEELTAMGYTGRGGRPLAVSTIYGILSNERTYRGEYHYGKNSEWVPGVHEPILK